MTTTQTEPKVPQKSEKPATPAVAATPTKPQPLSQPKPQRKEPEKIVLRFTPTAWAKLLYFRDFGDTEVGGFGVTAKDNLLLVEDFVTVRQKVSVVSVSFDDDAVADFFESQVDAGRRPEQFGRIWLHTHPGDSPQPSMVDEETFERVFGRCEWAVALGAQPHDVQRTLVGRVMPHQGRRPVAHPAVLAGVFPGDDAEPDGQQHELAQVPPPPGVRPAGPRDHLGPVSLVVPAAGGPDALPVLRPPHPLILIVAIAALPPAAPPRPQLRPEFPQRLDRPALRAPTQHRLNRVRTPGTPRPAPPARGPSPFRLRKLAPFRARGLSPFRAVGEKGTVPLNSRTWRLSPCRAVGGKGAWFTIAVQQAPGTAGGCLYRLIPTRCVGLVNHAGKGTVPLN
jgi:proteasome lid subunit RPN8/RPN11